MNIQWRLDEIQSPVAGRKSSPGNTRSIDPAPVVQLRCTVDPHMIPGFKKLELLCKVDLFRLPEAPNLSNKWSYYARDGTYDNNQQPVYALFLTDSRPPEVGCIGNHLLFYESKETHLLRPDTVSHAVETPDGRILFAFPGLGVMQTGQYLLQYIVFNRRTDERLATCLGKPFRIFSVGTFPGMQPPTQLSKLLGRLNVIGFQSR
ncbi:hypothetical protein B0H12DRAFT_645354 [Mycena haematopus]|nr:hypothetical protein B0H12DRAFT_645354 [Mycena haematopus]